MNHVIFIQYYLRTYEEEKEKKRKGIHLATLYVRLD